MCCLKYEQDAYEDLLRRSPKVESFVDTPDGRGTVVEVDLLRQRVKVRMEDQPETITSYANEDIAVLRNGKPKKNDPPIPDDLAPISGTGKPSKPAVQEDSPAVLDPIRFRYSTESIVEEEIPENEEPVADDIPVQAEEKSSRSRRRNRKNKPRPAEESAEPAEAAPEELPEEPAEAQSTAPDAAADSVPAKKRPHRRPNYRRNRKPRSSGDNSAPAGE
jgi:hypothetical protein